MLSFDVSISRSIFFWGTLDWGKNAIMIEFTRRHIINYRCKRDLRPMQGTALLLLTITISISMLLNSPFTLEKKINSNPRCTLITKVNKKVGTVTLFL